MLFVVISFPLEIVSLALSYQKCRQSVYGVDDNVHNTQFSKNGIKWKNAKRQKENNVGLEYLTSLSTTCQLYHGGQFYW
jgi:hypothetical protein